MENPWDIDSIYDLQYFNCPSCLFKDPSKQELINHAFEFHPDSTVYLVKIKDDSLIDIICPWNNIEIKNEITESESIDPSMLDVSIKLEEPEYDLDNLDNFITDTHTVDKPPKKIKKAKIKKEKSENSNSNNENQIHYCEICGKDFKKADYLRKHISLVHDRKKEDINIFMYA